MTLAPSSNLPSVDAMRAANVNPATGLATDYLNAFNEPLMLLGFAGDDPEVLDDLEGWTAPSYRAHFEASAFAGRAVILAAYEAAPDRAAFDAAAAALAATVSAAIEDVRAAVASGADVPERVGEISQAVQLEISRLDGLIHGADRHTDQSAIDALFD